MIIAFAHKDNVLGFICYDYEALCPRDYDLSRRSVYNLWSEVFDYCADRQRQKHIDKILLLQDYTSIDKVAMTSELSGMLQCIAAEINSSSVVECKFQMVQYIDEYLESDAWKALPDKQPTAVALALAAAMKASEEK